MNQDILKGKWTQFKGDVQKQWGKLTNDHLDQINGDRKVLLGKLQETYGIAADEAEKQVSEFEKTCSSKCDKQSAA